jgi:hypothetical protein
VEYATSKMNNSGGSGSMSSGPHFFRLHFFGEIHLSIFSTSHTERHLLGTAGTTGNMAAKTPIAAIFDSLKGTWRLRRSLNSVLPGFPSGMFEGVATFTSRAPTAHSINSELLYSEQGELKTDNGYTLHANRKYIYRYNADEDKISAWFVKEDTKSNDGQEEVDELFHDLEISSSGSGLAGSGLAGSGEHLWAGRGEHLCSLDMYWAYYEFRVPKIAQNGHEMNVFGVRYKVKGPQKDYTSDAAYERMTAVNGAAL